MGFRFACRRFRPGLAFALRLPAQYRANPAGIRPLRELLRFLPRAMTDTPFVRRAFRRDRVLWGLIIQACSTGNIQLSEMKKDPSTHFGINESSCCERG